MAKFILRVEVCKDGVPESIEECVIEEATKNAIGYVRNHFNDVDDVEVNVEFKNIYRSEISEFGWVEDGEYQEEGLTTEEKERMLEAVLA